jgi:peptidoglycan hydrolase-like protein with peptidoglycan-binding domain
MRPRALAGALLLPAPPILVSTGREEWHMAVTAVARNKSRSIRNTQAHALKQLHKQKYGSSGPEVTRLQKLLKSKGLYKGPIDGKFGPITRGAVRAYQKQHGLVVDGVVGQQTWGSLLFGQSFPPGFDMLARPQLRAVSDGFEQGPRPANPYSSAPPTRSFDGVPPELARYGNGRIPASALSPIGVGSHRLWGPAADAYKRMVADAARAGVKIGITDSYRSYEQQVDLARRKGLYSQGGLAATPGKSKHGWGLAVDLDLNSEAQAWMRANGPRYGFHETVPREPWHWEFKGVA